MKHIETYSFGVGDRFTMQGRAQLKAVIQANREGIPLVPVWNKSNREHQIVGTVPEDTWREATEAVGALGYKGSWYVDADHINLSSVGPYIAHSNFFTLDVADRIGVPADRREAKDMVQKLQAFTGSLGIPGIDQPFTITVELLEKTVQKFFSAVKEAALIYNHILQVRETDDFIAEMSMDEVDEAQSPVELFFILVMADHFGIPLQTIAPKFTGRFNKGVDYVGDVSLFRKEFEEDLLVIDHAVNTLNLPQNLKLSVHSGSDKFSIYPVIGALIRKHNKGIHIKTAGTTWLEEVIGLAMAGGDALRMAHHIYKEAYRRMDELCAPYATVINIDPDRLPSPEMVASWGSKKFADTLRHIPGHADYDPMFRQLIHVGYKVASEMGEAYTAMLSKHASIVEAQVTENIMERHIRRLFIEG